MPYREGLKESPWRASLRKGRAARPCQIVTIQIALAVSSIFVADGAALISGVDDLIDAPENARRAVAIFSLAVLIASCVDILTDVLAWPQGSVIKVRDLLVLDAAASMGIVFELLWPGALLATRLSRVGRVGKLLRPSAILLRRRAAPSSKVQAGDDMLLGEVRAARLFDPILESEAAWGFLRTFILLATILSLASTSAAAREQTLFHAPCQLVVSFVVAAMSVLSVVQTFVRLHTTMDRELDKPLSAVSSALKDFAKARFDDGVAFVPSRAYELQRIQEELIRIRHTLASFSKFVPRELVRYLMAKPRREAQLGVQPREVTILFSDIEGFTTLAEKLSPDALLQLLSEYFEAMAEVIAETRGCLIEFVGDAILAVWNAPLKVTRHAVRAIEAALRMRKRLAALRKTWILRGLPDVDIRIGIHTSVVFVGNLGAPCRLKYGVMGDGVNLASRLEELNKRYNTRLLVSHQTAKATGVGRTFSIRPIDIVAVKGRKEPVTVYEVLGSRETMCPTERFLNSCTREICEKHTTAMDAYLRREFLEAAKILNQVQLLHSNRRSSHEQTSPAYRVASEDIAAAILRERCEYYCHHPPPESWTGCEVLKEKTW